ncbi:MAG: hypothetical protein DRP27_03000 [Thermotogae bacterium]|nr:MAG: hypothetical protein DRP27_03000 [Thermotogota bacterium]
MKKVALLSMVVLMSLMAQGLTVQSNPALIQWDHHRFFFGGVGLNASLRQNFITVEDWNNFFEGATITIDEERLGVISDDLAVSLPVDANVNVGFRLGELRLMAGAYVENRIGVTLPSDVAKLLLEGIKIGEYEASEPFFEGWTIAGAGLLLGMNVGKLKLGVNTSAYFTILDVIDSNFEFSYVSSTETARIRGDLSASVHALSAFNPFNFETELEALLDDPQSFLNDYAGIKMDVGVAYGDGYPLWGIGIRNIVLKPAKARFTFDAEVSAEASVTMPYVEDASYTYDYYAASSTLTEPVETTIPMELTGFVTLPLGSLNLTLSGSYLIGTASSNAYTLEATAWIPWKLLPIGLSYGYDSNGYYRKAASLGLNLHVVSLVLEGYVVSKQPLDIDPEKTPLSGGISLNFALGF